MSKHKILFYVPKQQKLLIACVTIILILRKRHLSTIW